MQIQLLTDEQAAKKRLPPVQLCIVGKAKIGKSTFASKFPKPIAICTEAGMVGIKIPTLPGPHPETGHEQVADTWPKFLECLKFVSTNEEAKKRKTLIIDTIDVAQRLCESFIIKTVYDDNADAYASYARGLIPMRREFMRVINKLEVIRNMGMNIVLIAHSGLQKGEDTLGQDYKKEGGDLEPQCWAKIRNHCDQIGYAKVMTRVSDKKVKQLGHDRFMVFDDHPGREAGCRGGYEMPSKIPLDYNEYKKHMKGKINGED
jgi:hypothetical protein